MNERSDIDGTLRHWFSEGPNVMPDRVVDGVAGRIARQPQRRTWRLQGRPIMNLYARLAVAAAAVLVVVFVGWQLLPAGAGDGGRQTPAPTRTSVATTPSPTSVPTFACEDALPGCSGPLSEGVHGSSHFAPRLIHFVTPAGWTNSIDTDTIYKLDAPDGATSILLWADVSIEDQTPASCDPVASGKAPSADQWVSYLTSHPGLVTTTPVPTDFPGGQDKHGMSLDVSMAPTWTQTCPDGTEPVVQFIAHTTPPLGVYGVSASANVHIVALDANGYGPHTVLIEIYGPGDAAGLADAVAQSREVLSTFVFGCGPSAGYGPCSAYPFSSP